MLTGFNTNVPFRGKTYHVQTEDSGEQAPTVTTLLYLDGTILSRRSFSYAEMMSIEGWKEQVADKMRKQHIGMIREVLAGMHLRQEEKTENPG
ncbi:MAG: hypothetical protein PVJ36_05255 [Nitrospirota bacterium]|jgi:hypothetical protein